MFQYTKEIVLNSLTMPDGTPRIVAPVNDEKEKHALVIKRGGEYWKEFIEDQGAKKHVVYRTDGNEGKYEILQLDVAQLLEENSAQKTYQINMFIKLLDPHALYDYGYPMYNSFGKHFLVGYDVDRDEDAASLAKKLYESFRWAMDKEYVFVGAYENGEVREFAEGDTVLGFRATHFGSRFDTVTLSVYDETSCDSCLGEYLPYKDLLEAGVAKVADEDKGVEPFATGEWLQENLRFPTYPNIRYHAPGYQDYPMPGTLYVQFSFAYRSPRPQFGGLSGVGQVVEASTRHIYYVPASLADQFEQAFSGMGCEIVKTNEVEVTNPDTNAVEGNPTEPTPEPTPGTTDGD